MLYLGWINRDIIDLKTGKPSEISSLNNQKIRYQNVVFSNIVLIWGLPSKLKAREIQECISKVFSTCSITSI